MPLAALLGWTGGFELTLVESVRALSAQAGSGDVDGVVLGVGADGTRALHALEELRTRVPELPLIVVVPDPVPLSAATLASLGVTEILKRSGLTARALAEACTRGLRVTPGRSVAKGADQAVLDALAEPAALLDPAGVIVAVNAAWHRSSAEHGLALRDHAVGANYLGICLRREYDGKEDGAAVADGIRGVMSGERKEFRRRYACHGPRDRRWCEVVATPATSHPWRAVLVQHRDVTQDEQAREVARDRERRAEARLSSEHAMLEGILKNADDAIYVKNLRGEFQLVNRAAASLLGRDVGDVIGRRSGEILAADAAASAERLDQEVIASGMGTTREETMVTERGERVILISRSPFIGPDGRILGVVGVGKDITEWRLAEREAAEKRAHLNRIVEFAPDAMITVNARQEIVAFNPAAERMFGHSAAEIVGAPLDSLIPERFRAAHRAHLATFAASGISLHRMEARNAMVGLRANGEEFPVEGSLMQYPEGGELLQSVILRDLTERHRIERALQAAQDEIRQVQKLDAIGQLASGVAHDFNNALTVILASAQIARELLPPGSQALEELRQVELAAGHAAGLSNQLLAFARRQVLKPVQFDLNALLEEVEPMLRLAIGAAIGFQARYSANLGDVLADPNQIKQVLMNLVVNARDAMPNGGSLTVETEMAYLHERYTTPETSLDPGSYVVLAVSDTGIGMDEDTLNRIFEPFFTTKGPGRGTGLGLATTYGIVKQSGGYILAESTPGKGTTFRVYLPRVESEAPAPDEPPLVPSPDGGGETILLVEDNPQIANVAARVLRGGGYSVIAAPGPLEALEIFRQDPCAIDAVVSDVMMPDLNGIELRERLLAIRPELRVLFVSGHAERMAREGGGLPEGVVLLAKPYGVEQLRLAVRALFG